MANDVEIIVEASVADALVKLDLVKHAVKDVGDAGGVTSKQIGDESNRSSLVSSMGRLEQHLLKFNGSGPFGLGALETGLARVGGRVLTLTNGFATGTKIAGDWIKGITDGIPVLEQMGTGLATVVEGLGSLVAALGPVVAGVGILAGGFLALDIAVNALATTLGTAIAIVADLVAPVTLVTGLLGGLGAAFFIAAKAAFGQNGALGGQLQVLKHQFDNLTKTLETDFMPVFKFLIDNAHQALTYLNQIAKLPLDEAFRSLATKGVQGVSKFLGQVGSMLARPFRLAVQIAFGTGKGGNEVASAVSGLWKQFTDFFFGYTKSHPVKVGGKFIGITQTQVDGALQPVIDWFNRHHFTKQGEKIGREILNGMKPLAAPLGRFLVTVIEDAAKQSAKDFLNIFRAAWGEWRHLGGQARAWLIQQMGSAWDWIKNKAGGIINSIQGWVEGKLSSAWNAVKSAANRVWNFIKGLFDEVLNVHISWPSPPGWVNSILGAGGSILHGASSLAGSVAGSIPSAISTGGATPSVAGANVVVVQHFHSVDISTNAQRRRVAADLGDEVVRRFRQQAGG